MPVLSKVISIAPRTLLRSRIQCTRRLNPCQPNTNTFTSMAGERKRQRTEEKPDGELSGGGNQHFHASEAGPEEGATETEPSKDHRGAHDTTTTHEEEAAASSSKEGSWRTQPPYRSTDLNDNAQKIHEAECNCGRVRYWLSRRKPLAAKLCHCTDCQSLHGAPLQWAAVFHKVDLHFENGSKGLAFYNTGKKHTQRELPAKVSCAYCHAPIMDEGRNMVLIFPSIIKFESEKAKKDFDPT
jgi:hypothetical protein